MVSTWFVLLVSFFLTYMPNGGRIELTITNLKNNKGTLLICLFDREEGFPSDVSRSMKQWKVPVSPTVILEQIPAGKYALAIMHDEDGNNAMTYNRFSFPKEGFGFSNYSASLLQRPDFHKALFEHRHTGTHLRLKLRY